MAASLQQRSALRPLRNSPCRLYTSRAQAPSGTQNQVSLSSVSIVSIFICLRHHEVISSLNQRIEIIEGALQKPYSPETNQRELSQPTVTHGGALVKELVHEVDSDNPENAGIGSTDHADQPTLTPSSEGKRQSLARASCGQLLRLSINETFQAGSCRNYWEQKHTA